MDLEMWHAMHDDCPEEGCGQCVVVDLELSEDILEAAKTTGEDPDVFIHRAIIEGMRLEGH